MVAKIYKWTAASVVVNGVVTPGGWSVGNNWQVNGVAQTAPPPTGAAVVIGQGAVETGLSPLSVGSLTQSSASGAANPTTIDGSGELIVTGAATFGGQLAQTGYGTTLLEGASTFASGSLSLTGGRNLENLGTFVFEGSDDAIHLGDLTSGATFTNAAGGRINLESSVAWVDGNGNYGQTSLVNDGQFDALVGQSSVGVDFTDEAGGSVNVAAGASVDFSPSVSDSFFGSIAGAGAVSFGGASTTAEAIDFAQGLRVSVANLAIDNKAVVTVDDSLAYAGRLTLAGGGTLIAGVDEAVSLAQSVAGVGVLGIDAGATLSLAAGAASGVVVNFQGVGGTLSLGNVAGFLGTIENIAAGDSIFLKGVTATNANFDSNDDMLIVWNNGQIVAKLQLTSAESYLGSFLISPNAATGGTAISFHLPTLGVGDYAKTPRYNNGPGFYVEGSAANLSANFSLFDTLASNLTGIEVDDALPLQLAVTQAATALAAVEKLTMLSGAPYELALTGSSADILANLVALNAIGVEHIASIAVSGGGPLALTVAEWEADEALYARVSGGVEISDTAANIAANLDALDAGVNISSIVASDGGEIAVASSSAPAGGATPTISASQLASDGRALAMLAGVTKPTGADAYVVSGSAQVLQRELAILEQDAALISSVTDTSTGNFAVSAAQFVADAAALGLIKNVGLAVTGTAAQISAELDALALDTSVKAVSVKGGGRVAVSVAQLTKDAGVVGMLESSGAGVALEDSLANLAGGASSAPIVVVDSYANISSASSSELAAFGSQLSGYIVRDTLDDDLAALPAIDALSHLKGVEITGSASAIEQNLAALVPQATRLISVTSNFGPVDASFDDAMNYTAVLDAIAGGYDLTLTAAQFNAELPLWLAQASHIDSLSLLTGPLTVSLNEFLRDRSALDKIAGGFSISDTGVSVTHNLAALQADAAHIDAVALASGSVSVNASTFEADKAALGRIAQGYSVTDSGADISAAFADLAANDDHIDALTISGSGTQTLNITSAEQSADSSFLHTIAGAFVLNVMDAATKSATTTGNADGLTLVDPLTGGNDIMTGGGAGETFVLKAGFGTAAITDFDDHLYGTLATQDKIILSKADFVPTAGNTSWQMLLGDARQVGSDVVIAAGQGDTLTLENMTLNDTMSNGVTTPGLKSLAANFRFV